MKLTDLSPEEAALILKNRGQTPPPPAGDPLVRPAREGPREETCTCRQDPGEEEEPWYT